MAPGGGARREGGQTRLRLLYWVVGSRDRGRNTRLASRNASRAKETEAKAHVGRERHRGSSERGLRDTCVGVQGELPGNGAAKLGFACPTRCWPRVTVAVTQAKLRVTPAELRVTEVKTPLGREHHRWPPGGDLRETCVGALKECPGSVRPRPTSLVLFNVGLVLPWPYHKRSSA